LVPDPAGLSFCGDGSVQMRLIPGDNNSWADQTRKKSGLEK